MQIPKPNHKPGQTAHDIAVAHVSLKLAQQMLERMADLPVITEPHLEKLRLHMGRANAHCAKIANGFDANGGNR